MNKAERKQHLLQKISKSGTASVRDLIEEMPFSRATVQRDLAELEMEGVLERSYGSVTYLAKSGTEFVTLYDEKHIDRLAEKIRIGKKAQTFIRNDDIVFLSHGTTSVQVLRDVDPGKEFTVITDGLDVTMGCRNQRSIRTCLLGGICNYETNQIEYSLSVSMQLKLINPRCLITGIGGISVGHGVTFRDYMSFALLKEVAEKVEEIIVVADSTKIGKVALANGIPTEQITRIITDHDADPELLEQFRKLGVECLTV